MPCYSSHMTVTPLPTAKAMDVVTCIFVLATVGNPQCYLELPT